ncbi:MAG: Cell division protein SepF [Firmicutes bacterium ADurb.Bin193]|nr:MAG: Cell division protein SepF [Firmicutes bacterium ADurb.Bin193]
MSSFLNKFKSFVGFDTDIDEEQDFLGANREDEREFTVKKGKVVNIHTTTQLKVVVVSPESFEEARDIAEHLKSKKPVVINLEGVEREIARRIVDFLSGAVFSLDGNIQKISSGIFLIAPYNVGIMGDFKDELRSKGVFPWSY